MNMNMFIKNTILLTTIVLSLQLETEASNLKCVSLFCEDNNIVEIPINNNTNNTSHNGQNGNRSIIAISAFYYVADKVVEVNCFNIGITNVTLYGPMGIPVDTYTFDSNSEPMVVLSVPSDSGTYRIVIDADKYSGEGEFEVR